MFRGLIRWSMTNQQARGRGRPRLSFEPAGFGGGRRGVFCVDAPPRATCAGLGGVAKARPCAGLDISENSLRVCFVSGGEGTVALVFRLRGMRAAFILLPLLPRAIPPPRSLVLQHTVGRCRCRSIVAHRRLAISTQGCASASVKACGRK